MFDEHWATFSIYDHRTDLYRRALLLFDRIVVPIPSTPFGRLTPAEIEQLSSDVDYLQENDAAIRFDWDPQGFQDWQKSVVGEAMASTLTRDRQLATRLQVAQDCTKLIPPGIGNVSAVPVYRDPVTYDASVEDLKYDVQEAPLLEIVLPRLAVPEPDAPLSSIVEFRKKEEYRDSLYHLRRWQDKILPEIMNEQDPQKRKRYLDRASRDFDHWIKIYAEAMEDANFAKMKAAVVSVLAVGAALSPFSGHLVVALSAVASPLFSIRELRKPCWKVVGEKECAPAAIVYASARI